MYLSSKRGNRFSKNSNLHFQYCATYFIHFIFGYFIIVIFAYVLHHCVCLFCRHPKPTGDQNFSFFCRDVFIKSVKIKRMYMYNTKCVFYTTGILFSAKGSKSCRSRNYLKVKRHGARNHS